MVTFDRSGFRRSKLLELPLFPMKSTCAERDTRGVVGEGVRLIDADTQLLAATPDQQNQPARVLQLEA
jgi:hypothetical protein